MLHNCARVCVSWLVSGLPRTHRTCGHMHEGVHYYSHDLIKQQLALACPPPPPGGAAMMDFNGRLPRLAFGHLDQDGCVEEGAQLTVDVAVRHTLAG